MKLTPAVRAWIGCVAFLVLVKLAFIAAPDLFYGDSRMALFDWPSIAIIGLAGLVGVLLAQRTGFPEPSLRPFGERLLAPIAIGAALGALGVLLDLVGGGTKIFLAESGLARFNMPLPASLVFYPGGAIFVEVAYRLLPIPLLLWLVSNVALRGRWREQTFWVLAVLTSAIEPLSQETSALPHGVLLFAGLFGLGYAFNFAQAVFFRRSGFLASIVVRLGYYAVWHILYGDLICRC